MNRNDFKLVELSFSNGLVKYKANVTKKIGETTYTEKLNNQNTLLPHPSLEEPFLNDFKDIVVRVLGYTSFEDWMSKLDVKTEDEKIAISSLQHRFVSFQDRMIESTRVTGIKLTGSDNKSGVEFSGKIRLLTSTKEISFKTPVIRLKDSKLYGFEEELEKQVNDVSDEAFYYIIQGKTSEAEPIEME